jgi:hypothetical protein
MDPAALAFIPQEAKGLSIKPDPVTSVDRIKLLLFRRFMTEKGLVCFKLNKILVSDLYQTILFPGLLSS